MEIATCECVAGMPLQDQLTQIYNVRYTLAGSPGDLPTPECVAGMTIPEKASAIYCATLAWSNL